MEIYTEKNMEGVFSMAAIQEPRNGIYYGWTEAENGWKAGMDANLKFLGLSKFCSAINFTTTTPPPTPSDGDMYIVATGATGAWASHDGQIAVWAAGAWYFIVPKNGYLCYDESTDTLQRYLSGAWSTNGPSFT
jgi:hypothetical protein